MFFHALLSMARRRPDSATALTTQSQNKPVALLNTLNYYEFLLQFLDHSDQQGFIHPTGAASMIMESEPSALLDQMTQYN